MSVLTRTQIAFLVVIRHGELSTADYRAALNRLHGISQNQGCFHRSTTKLVDAGYLEKRKDKLTFFKITAKGNAKLRADLLFYVNSWELIK